MKSRDILPEEVRKPHFEPIVTTPETQDVDLGVRNMNPLAPFVISGGKNTERYYFKHVNDYSKKHHFNVRPEYFGDESDFVEQFPIRIKEILDKNADAKIYCIYDMDTIVAEEKKKHKAHHQVEFKNKHEKFLSLIPNELKTGQVVICNSMPSFEFWLLLHFEDGKGWFETYGQIAQKVAPHLKNYFTESSKGFKKLIKSEKHLKDSIWVERLIAEDRIQQAIERAKACQEQIDQGAKDQSYSNVYKAFE